MTVPEDTERRILHKATYVEEALTVLSRKQSLSPDAYRNDREQRAIVEREFQTAIEACLDIAGLVLTATDEPMPETYAGRFRRLEELGIVSPETSEKMRGAAGFRNVLAHNYGDDLDHDVVYNHLQNQLEWFVRFLTEIRDYLTEP